MHFELSFPRAARTYLIALRAGGIGSTDDCGFSPFSIDVKPNHGSPDVARDIAFQKITNRILGTKMAAQKLGIDASRA